MRDLGIQKPFLQYIETTSPQAKNYVGIRKLFVEYLAKLNVPFIDMCCIDATGPFFQPLRYNDNTDVIERFDPGTATWVEVDTGGGGIQSIVEGTGVTVDDSDPLNPIVSSAVTPSSLKAILDRSLKSYFALPKNFESTGILSVTKAGALSAVTPVQVGSYDQYEVTGGDQTSLLTFDDYLLTDSACKVVFTVKVDDLGTLPFIGVSIVANSAYNRLNFGNENAVIYFKPSIPSLQGKIATGTYPAGFDFNTGGSPFVVNDGDIIEITLRRYLHEKIGWESLVVNKTTGAFMSRKIFGLQPSNMYNSAANVGLILADGKYTILGYDVVSQEGEGAKVAIIGDSTATQFNTVFPRTVTNILDSSIFYRTVVLGGGFTDIRGLVRGSIPELLILKAQAVIIMTGAEIFSGWYKAANGNHALFVSSTQAIVDAVRSYGGIAVMTQWPHGFPTVSNSDIDEWNLWVTNNAGAIGSSILDLRATTPNADGSGFVIGYPFTQTIATEIINLLTTQGLLP